MSKDTENKEDKGWSLSVGLYPGILLGMRSYVNEDYTDHVFYLPFIDVCYTVEK